MASRSTSEEEARVYLQQLKEQGLDVRQQEKLQQEYLQRLIQEREDYVEAQLRAQTQVAN